MGQVIPVQQFEESIAHKAASSVLHRVSSELAALQNQQDKDLSWFESVLELFLFAQDIEGGFSHVKAVCLTLIKDNWDALPFELRRRYSFQFMTFARAHTGKERSTVDNWIRTARVWILGVGGREPITPPFNKVTIPVRDESGKPTVDEHGRPIKRDVEWNPLLVDPTKLLYANSRAMSDEMTEDLWVMLADNFYSCEDLSLAIRGTPTSVTDTYEIHYSLEGPGIFANRNGESKWVADLNWEDYYADDPLVREAVDHVCTCLRVMFDEDIIYLQERNSM